jgi:hypothetical protein
LFNAFGLLKAVEAGKGEIIEELLRPQLSSGTAIMGYMVATRWGDTRGTEAYPYVEPPQNVPSQEWMRKMTTAKSLLPAGGPSFHSGGWDIKGLPGLHENLHKLVRAAYQTYLLWRVSIVAASRCNAEVFRILLDRRSSDNAALAKSLEWIGTQSGRKRGDGMDQEGKRVVADRAKMDTLMYQLVEEYSTKNYHDAMLYTLWGHIQRGGRNDPAGPAAGNPRCVALAQNGLWEMTLEVPLLMMPVEYALQDEEPFRRYKQLTLLYNQRAKVNIQLLATVEAQPNFLQVSRGSLKGKSQVEGFFWFRVSGLGLLLMGCCDGLKPGDSSGEACEVQSGEFEVGWAVHGAFSDGGVAVCDAAVEGGDECDHDEFVLEQLVQGREGGEHLRGGERRRRLE